MEYSEGWQGYSERFSEMESIEAVNAYDLKHQHFQSYISLGNCLCMRVLTKITQKNHYKQAGVSMPFPSYSFLLNEAYFQC